MHVHSLEFCRVLTGCSKRDVQRALWWKISAANNADKKRSGQADLHPSQGPGGNYQAMLNVAPLARGAPHASHSQRAAAPNVSKTISDEEMIQLLKMVHSSDQSGHDT
ncbi:hypothetical protein ACOMHN_052562 [Nucella lapillus]